MNYLNILFPPEDCNAMFTHLKRQFGNAVSEVTVDTVLENNYIEIRWNGLLDPLQVAQKLTEAIPTLIIEGPSDSGIENTSRFFNKQQLW